MVGDAEICFRRKPKGLGFEEKSITTRDDMDSTQGGGLVFTVIMVTEKAYRQYLGMDNVVAA